LIASSFTLEIFRRRFAIASVASESAAHLDLWLYATLALGLFFVAGQYAAWRQLHHEGVYVASNPSSSFFYLLTGIHAIHVLGGLGGLTYALSRLKKLSLTANAFGVLSKYWHFMGLLWLYLLGLLWAKL
jgi:cytochrome c oxidase subunit III